MNGGDGGRWTPPSNGKQTQVRGVKAKQVSAVSAVGLSLAMMRRAALVPDHAQHVGETVREPVVGSRVWALYCTNKYAAYTVYPATITAVHYEINAYGIGYVASVHVRYWDLDQENTHRNANQVFFRNEEAPGDNPRIGEVYPECFDDMAEERRHQQQRNAAVRALEHVDALSRGVEHQLHTPPSMRLRGVEHQLHTPASMRLRGVEHQLHTPPSMRFGGVEHQLHTPRSMRFGGVEHQQLLSTPPSARQLRRDGAIQQQHFPSSMRAGGDTRDAVQQQRSPLSTRVGGGAAQKQRTTPSMHVAGIDYEVPHMLDASLEEPVIFTQHPVIMDVFPGTGVAPMPPMSPNTAENLRLWRASQDALVASGVVLPPVPFYVGPDFRLYPNPRTPLQMRRSTRPSLPRDYYDEMDDKAATSNKPDASL